MLMTSTRRTISIEERNRWEDLPFSWIKRISIAKISI
jgi:hypothetical protein